MNFLASWFRSLFSRPVITEDHWLKDAVRKPLPGGRKMDTRRFLVIHFTAGASAQSSIDYWKQIGNGVCAHIVIDRDGTVMQCRPFDRTCGHAGKSEWRDPKTKALYKGLNSCSIGIELANGGDTYPKKFSKLPPVKAAHKNGGKAVFWERYPEAQLEALRKIAPAICKRYKLDDVVGHDDIAPHRKSDPGPAFPMGELRTACGFPANY